MDVATLWDTFSQFFVSRPWLVLLGLLVLPNVPVPASLVFPAAILALLPVFGPWGTLVAVSVVVGLAYLWGYLAGWYLFRRPWFRAGFLWVLDRVEGRMDRGRAGWLERLRGWLVSSSVGLGGRSGRSATVVLRSVPGIPLFLQTWVLGALGVPFGFYLGFSLVVQVLSVSVWVFGAEAVSGFFRGDVPWGLVAGLAVVLLGLWGFRRVIRRVGDRLVAGVDVPAKDI